MKQNRRKLAPQNEPKCKPSFGMFWGTAFGGGFVILCANGFVMAGRLLRTDFPVVIDPVLEGAAKYYILGSQDSI